MEENSQIQTPPTTAIPPKSNENKKIVIIVIVAIIIIACGYWVFHRWQQTRALREALRDLGKSTEMAGDSLANVANQIAEEAARLEAEAKKTPADKFNEAETFKVSDHGKEKFVDDAASIIKSVFGDTKVTGFTEGYMGMNSGSGVVQFMTPSLLETSKANDLVKKLQDEEYQIISTAIDEISVSITASKNDADFTFTYNKGDQSITTIIISH